MRKSFVLFLLLFVNIITNAHDCALSVVLVQHKKLSVEGGGISRDFKKGQKQGDLEIWDPVDQVLSEQLLHEKLPA